MRLLRALILLVFTFVVIVTAAVASGRARPASPGLAMLHLDMCAPPCWLGITPGVTTLQDANRLIAQTYPPSLYKILPCGCTIQDLQNPDHEFSILLDADNKSIVDDIVLSLDNVWMNDQWTPVDKPLISWAELNSLWGSPHYIAVHPCVGSWLPEYQEPPVADVVVAPSEWFSDTNSPTSWNLPVDGIELSYLDSETLPHRQWRGFLTYRQYNYDHKGFDVNQGGGC